MNFSSDALSNLIEFRDLVDTLTNDEYQTFISQFCALFSRTDIISIIYNAFFQTRHKTQIKKIHNIVTSIIQSRDDDEYDNKLEAVDDSKANKLCLTDLSSHSIQYTASYLSLNELINFEQSSRFISICCRTSNASKHLNHAKWLQKYLKQNYNASINYSLFRENRQLKHQIDIRSRFKNVTNVTFNFNNIAYVCNDVIDMQAHRQLFTKTFYPLNKPFYVSAVAKQLLAFLFKAVINLNISLNDYWTTNIFDFNFDFDPNKRAVSTWEGNEMHCPHSQNACVVPDNPLLLFSKLSRNNIVCENDTCQHGQCWICLQCHAIFCSRYGNQCMLSHHLLTNTEHCIVMKIDKIEFWCYKCDDYINYSQEVASEINAFYNIAEFAQSNGNYDEFIKRNQELENQQENENEKTDNEEVEDENDDDVGEIFENLEVLKMSNCSIRSVLKFVHDMNFPNIDCIQLCNLRMRIGRNWNNFNVYDIYESIQDEEAKNIAVYVESFVDFILPNYYALKSKNENVTLRKGYKYLTIENSQFRTNNDFYDAMLERIFADEANIIVSLKDLVGLCVDDSARITVSLLDGFVVCILNTLSSQLLSLHLRSFPMIHSIKYKEILLKNLEELCIDTESQKMCQNIHIEVTKKIKTLKRLHINLVRFAREKHETTKPYLDYLAKLSLIFANNWHCLQYLNVHIFDTTNSLAIKEFMDEFIINGLRNCGSKQIESLQLKFDTESTYFYYDINELKELLEALYKHCVNCMLVINNKMMKSYAPDPNKIFDEKIKKQFENIVPQLFTNKIVVNQDDGCCDMIIYTKRNCILPPFPKWRFMCNHCK